MTPRVVDAQPADAQRLAAILLDWIVATAWMPRLHTREDTVEFCGRLISKGTRVVRGSSGGAAGFLSREDTDIAALYIAAEARGNGLGRALLDDAKATSARLRLWTFQANLPARRFYRRAGFSVTAQTDGAGNEERLPDLELTWWRQ